jgi:uncharacterized membrane protein YdbT with pleckstrin-like domain
MEQEFIPPEIMVIRPATIFAFIKIFPLILAAFGFLFLAARYYPMLVWLSMAIVCFAWYRYLFIRRSIYELTAEIIRIRRGIFFRRTDQVELWRIKDYVITQPFLLQVFGLMDLTLKGTDPENPVIWLRGIPSSDLVDILRHRVNEARQNSKIVELN